MAFPGRREPPDYEETAKVPPARICYLLCFADTFEHSRCRLQIGDVTVRSQKYQRNTGEMTFPGRRVPPDCEQTVKDPAARSAFSLYVADVFENLKVLFRCKYRLIFPLLEI